MPKIPTFTAKGSIEQLAGTTSNIKMGLNNTLASALAPVTETVVNFKIKENELENRTDALKLKNDFIFESDKVTDHINKDPFLSTNKNAANKYLKDNTTLLMDKFAAQASTPNSAQIFKNSALRDISKQISSLDKDLSTNILQKATTVYGTSKKEMFLKAYTKGGMYKDALEDDYRDLITNSFINIVTYPELQTMLSNVKNEIQLLDGSQDVSKSPRKTLQLLKNEKYLPDINIEQREILKNQAISILRPQIKLEYENVLANIEAGIKPPYFDWDILPDVMTESVADKMMANKTVVEDEVDNVKLLSGVPLDKLDEVASELIQDGYDSHPIDVAIKKDTFLKNIISAQKESLKTDPADFVLKTSIEMQNKAIEIQNMTAIFTAPNTYNNSDIVAAKSSFAEELLMKQETLKVEESNKKVMTNEMSKQFVADYMEASKKSDLETMRLMTDSLNNTYGDNDGKALKQLLEDKLPYGAKIQTIFKNEELAEEALSFDTPEEKTAFKNFLTNEGLKFEDISILVREELAPFEDILKRNVPLNSDGTLMEMDKLVEFLTFLAAKKMYSPLDLDENEAATKAAEAFSNNFEIAETFYVNRRVNGKDIGDERVNAFINTADSVRKFHLDDLNIVAFKSNFENDPEELTSEMMRQMSINGEWRNPSDGDGLIFGINTTNGFALAINADGNEIRLNQGDEIVPGTNIPIQFALRLDVLEENVVTSIIDTYEEAAKQARLQGITYEEALQQIEKPIIENVDFDDGKKNSKKPLDIFEDENSQPRFVGLNNNIDEKVLGLFEYGKDEGLKGLVPNNKGVVIGQSGVTIAMGYDLGSKTLNELKAMFPTNPDIVNKLKPYLGLKGKAALDAVNTTPFTITKNERETINKFATKKTLENLTSAWSKTTKNNKNATIKSFDKLPKEVATVIFSVAWQHGSSNPEIDYPNFWTQVTTGKWDDAIKNLRDWNGTGKPSQTQSRRDKEANILEKWLNTISTKS